VTGTSNWQLAIATGKGKGSGNDWEIRYYLWGGCWSRSSWMGCLPTAGTSHKEV